MSTKGLLVLLKELAAPSSFSEMAYNLLSPLGFTGTYPPTASISYRAVTT